MYENGKFQNHFSTVHYIHSSGCDETWKNGRLLFTDESESKLGAFSGGPFNDSPWPLTADLLHLDGRVEKTKGRGTKEP